ncbi:MAG TPA: ADP-ribosylglycohydrolase family protein [Solirubrobacteraceae bacterium]|jgi:poly(ADP-ribose) glycohydrolase ARH3|nr:ADP-ribosylglycohydrolase family protein [Solirubrobacteraceae bacterium]
MTDLGSSIAGSLLGLFCGDALGMPFEALPPDAIPERLEMEDARLGRGTYTDDTQMAIAVCESLLRRDGVDEEDLAATIAAAFDPRRGYGPGTTTVIRLWGEGVPREEAALRLFGGEGSAGNGAAMRVAPVGLRFARDPERCVAEARRQARLTHAHPLGVDGAAAQAAAVAAAVRGDDHLAAAVAAARTDELRARLEDAAELAGARTEEPQARLETAAQLAGARTDEPHAPLETAAELAATPWPPLPPAEAARLLGATVAAHESVPAALLAAAAPTFEAALTFAVRCGGDTDTVAAMAGAVAGARHGVEAIPARWLDALEDGAKGRSHVERLAQRLAQRVSAA